MEKENKVVLGVAVVMMAAIISLFAYWSPKRSEPIVTETPIGVRINHAETTLYTTTTNAAGGISANNVNDFQSIGITAVATAASGTLRVACSMQDAEPTFGVATTTANRWSFVDSVNTETEASVDGDTGYVLANTTHVLQIAVRNSVWKWCGVEIKGNTSPSGLGTTTVYMKPVGL